MSTLTALGHAGTAFGAGGVGFAVAASYPPYPLTQPAGPEPLAFLLPRAASSSPAPVADYRQSPPPGLVVGGSLPVAASYGPRGQLAWVTDGSTGITLSGLGLAGRQQLTLLLLFSLSNHSGQYYLCMYGGGTGGSPQSFDAYTNNAGVAYRARGAGGYDGNGFAPHSMNPPGSPSALALVADYTSPDPYRYIDAQGQQVTLTGGALAVTWSDQPLHLLQGQGGGLAWPANSLLRAALVFGDALTLNTAQQWLTYLDAHA